MSKYSLILLTFLQSFSLQAMSRITSQGSKIVGLRPTVALVGFTRPAQAVQPRQVRHIVDTADLVGSYASMPDRAFSPLHGALSYENGSLKKMLKTECPEVATKFFNELDGRIRFTVLGSNPAVALNPELIGQLLKELQQGTLYKNKEAIASGPIGQKWHELYLQTDKKSLKVFKDFKYAVRKLITALEGLKDDAKVRELLLVALYVKAVSREEVTEYLKKIDVKQNSEVVASISKDYEECALNLIEGKKDKSYVQFLPVPEMANEGPQGCEKRPMCAETSLWTVLNMILYNPDEGRLDLSLLSEEVQKSCNAAFKAFIEKYPCLPITNQTEKQLKDKYKAQENCKEDFFKLVWGIKDVEYLKPVEQYELSTSSTSSLQVLNHLFGTQAKSFSELATLLSSEKRTVNVTDCQEEFGQVQVKVSKHSSDLGVEGVWNFIGPVFKHVEFKMRKNLEENRIITKNYVQEIIDLEHAEQQKKGMLLSMVDDFIGHAIDWKKHTVVDIQCFFDEYNITQEEILKTSVKSNFYREHSCTLLHKAVYEQRVDLVQFFIEKGISADSLDCSGNSPLEYMWNYAMDPSERIKYMQLLLPFMHDQGQIVQCLNRIIDETKDKNVDMMRAALDAAVHFDKKQCGTLFYKVLDRMLYAHSEIMKKLFYLFIEKGLLISSMDRSSINIFLNKECFNREVHRNKKEIIKVMYKAGVDLRIDDNFFWNLINFEFDSVEEVKSLIDEFAVTEKEMAVTKEFSFPMPSSYCNGVEQKSRDYKRKLNVVQKALYEKRIDLAQFFIEKGISKERIMDTFLKSGCTRDQQVQFMEYVFSRMTDSDDIFLVLWDMHYFSKEIKIALKAAVHADKEYLMEEAMHYEYLDLVKALEEIGVCAFQNVKEKALHAYFKKNVRQKRALYKEVSFRWDGFLIDTMSDIQFKDEDGNTYIHTAVVSGHYDVIKRLIEKGLSVNTLNNKGETALDLAIRYQKDECIEILRAAGVVSNP